jgi:GAF domain-containing protein
VTQPLQDPASCPNPEPITCRSATRQLLVALLTLRHPAGDDRSDALIPGGTEDLLWWAQEGKQGYVLDSVVAVVAQLQELCEQARVMGQKEAAEEVVQVVPQVRQSDCLLSVCGAHPCSVWGHKHITGGHCFHMLANEACTLTF